MVVGRRLGAYELVAPLATGGMAELFIAKTAGVSGFEKQVALKVIHPNFSSDQDFVRMLIDEAKLAVQLQHANIVQTYDLGVVDGQYYIAMELVDGADLYKMLKSGAEKGLDFPVEVAAFIASEVATGLDYAHRKADPMGRPLQIVHRDVSPQNVLVSYEGEIKIVDFGIAKAALRGQQTQAGVIKGKYFYMSPEQAWGDRIDRAPTSSRRGSCCTRCSPARCCTSRRTSTACSRWCARPTSRRPRRSAATSLGSSTPSS